LIRLVAAVWRKRCVLVISTGRPAESVIANFSASCLRRKCMVAME